MRSKCVVYVGLSYPQDVCLGTPSTILNCQKKLARRLASEKGDLNSALSWLCGLLNDNRLDAWARAWAANNNVNNYELEMLPLPPSESAAPSQLA